MIRKWLLYPYSLLEENEKKPFYLWAIGKDYLIGPEVPSLWNERHAELMVLESDDLIDETLPKMIEFWRTHEKLSIRKDGN